MNDTANNAERTADTQAGKSTELKSTDTGVLSMLMATPQVAPKDAAPAAASKANPDAPGNADSQAGNAPGDDQPDDRLEPWMRKRLQRAEEKGRKLGRSEILDIVRPQQPDGAAQPGSQERTAAPAPASAQPAAAATPKTLADFDYDIERFTQYQIDEGVRKALTRRDQEAEQRKQEQTAQEARRNFERRKAEFESRVGEGAWDEMISMQVEVPQEVVDLLMGHEKDLDIAHYLVHHPQELAAFNGKSKLEIAHGLKGIEQKLPGAKRKEVDLPPRPTKAPPPPAELPSGTKSAKSIEEMSTEERIAEWRRQSESKKQRR